MSEAKKKTIFRATEEAKYKAVKEVEKKFPNPYDENPSAEETELLKLLEEKYMAETRDKYEISEAEQRDISIDGIEKGWPMAP